MAIVFKTPKSTLNTTSKQIQNLGGDCPPCPEPVLEGKELEYTQNGEYTVTPEQGVDGFSSIDVTVNIPSDVNNQDKTVSPSTSSQSVSADSGYSGLGTVTVNPVTSSIDANIQPENILSGVTILGVSGTDEGYSAGYTDGETAGHSAGYAEGEADGIVEGIAEQKAKLTSTTITENGTSTREDGWNSVTVNVDVTTPYNNGVAAGEAAQKAKLTSLNVTSNGTYNKEDGYNSVTVAVPSDINNQNKTVDPLTSSQSISADSGYSGLGTVTVNAVTSSIDQNITASNIKDGVTILGVTGTYDPQPNLQSKSVNPTTSAQTVSPDSGYDGLSQVSITAVTSAIDANIAAGNIKDGVTILGITGTYDPQPNLESQTASYTANGTYTITPSTGYDGMSDVEVTVNVSGSNCPDWSSIGWDCNDVAASGIDADVAYTAQKLANYTDFTNGYWQSDTNLVYAPNIIIRNAYTFKGDTNLTNVPNFVFKSGLTPNGITISELSITGMFENCKSLRTINLNLIDSGDGSESNGYVSNCSSMFSGCSLLKNVALTNTSGVLQFYRMFYSCTSLITAPILDTSNSLGFSEMFAGCTNLESVPQYDASNVSTVEGFFGSGNFNMCKKLTTLAGFTNLGKAFTGTNESAHTLNFQYNTVLTKESIMNVINNLAAPDDTTVTDATLKLSATSYALLSAEDIAIATAKRWTVTSA